MSQIPADSGLDSSLALVLEGYEFISNRCQRLQTNIFQTQLLFEKTICLRGEAGARLFYDTEKFSRKKAAPERLKKTLFGQNGVQGLDGDAHQHRKQMFMALMSPAGIQQLADLTREQWLAYAKKWESQPQIVLFYEAQEVICRAVCAWAGVPLPESEVELRTADLEAMIDGSGAIGPRHWRGRLGRQRAEKWISDLIQQVRDRTLNLPESSALYSISQHRDLEGNWLDQQVAAVEVINVLRPTVAIARYVTFAALALHEHPECRQKLADEDSYAELFVQEVRRFYPFFPFAAARVRQAFDWRDYPFPEGTRVLLDLYGTNHDPQQWENPDAFWPERFRQWDESPFNFIPQGGGSYETNHRCPGEWITLAVMKTTLHFLTQSIAYEVPKQDLAISLSRLPTIPKSRFVIHQVRRNSFR